MVTLSGAGSPGEGALAKRRRTKGRGRDFHVTIEFAAKIRMKAIADMMAGQAGAHADRAQDALRVLDIVLRESASERCSSSLNVYVCIFVLFVCCSGFCLIVSQLLQNYQDYCKMPTYRQNFHWLQGLPFDKR